MVWPRARICPLLMSRLYSRILDRIENHDYQVFGDRIGLPTSEKFVVALGAWSRNLVLSGAASAR